MQRTSLDFLWIHNMVASWTVNTINKELVGDTIYVNTTRDLWIDLKVLPKYAEKEIERMNECFMLLCSASLHPSLFIVELRK